MFLEVQNALEATKIQNVREKKFLVDLVIQQYFAILRPKFDD